MPRHCVSEQSSTPALCWHGCRAHAMAGSKRPGYCWQGHVNENAVPGSSLLTLQAWKRERAHHDSMRENKIQVGPRSCVSSPLSDSATMPAFAYHTWPLAFSANFVLEGAQSECKTHLLVY